MAVFKIEKQKNYTVMSNYHLQDRNLSYKAKGLLSFMLSLPEDWDYSMKGLVAVSKENIKAIRTILNELKEHGYLEIVQTRGEKGYYKYEYIIREIPIEIEKQKDNPDTQKGNTVEGDTEKDTQINTKKQNTKEQIVKRVKENLPFVDLDELNPLTLYLIEENYIDEYDTDIYNYDNLFEELLNEYSYQQVTMMTHYVVPKIVSRNFIDEDGKPVENKFGFFKGAIDNCIERLKINEELEIDPETGWFKDISNKFNNEIDEIEQEI
ncbi:MAG: hypothetical protein J6D28_06395 [Bacilli bacterium]|nr:hypothetical protein [Bacilli bacterium]MBP3921175.1 hypothetical protein [Bacilli bacterium]